MHKNRSPISSPFLQGCRIELKGKNIIRYNIRVCMYLEIRLESSLNQDRETDSGLMNSTERPVHFKLHLIYTNETELCVQVLQKMAHFTAVQTHWDIKDNLEFSFCSPFPSLLIGGILCSELFQKYVLKK